MEGSLEAADAIPRRGTHAVLRPALELCSETGVSLGEGSRVMVMPDPGGVAKALVGRPEKPGVEVRPGDRQAGHERAGGGPRPPSPRNKGASGSGQAYLK